MTYRIMSATTRTASKVFAALTATIMFAAIGVSYAVAQQAPAPARPRAAPAKPPAAPAKPAQAAPPAQQQQAPQQAQAGEAMQLIQSPWVKLCNKDADPKAKRVCATIKDGRVETGQLVTTVTIIEQDGEPRKILRLSMPYGVLLVQGTRLIVDQGTPATSPFVVCVPPMMPPGGCFADYDATPELINAMKKGQLLTVQAIHMSGQAMSPQLDLKDFAKAYDGPPTDPKVFEEQQKKLQDELQKRAEEVRKKLESQPPQTAAPGAPPAR